MAGRGKVSGDDKVLILYVVVQEIPR
jgi:hypothetical protein